VEITWPLKSFAELSVKELHALYHLRTAIFVVEQKCPYQEVDNFDPQSRHLLAWQGRALVACARVCPPASVYPQPSIGRVAVADAHRGQGLGKLVFARALAAGQAAYPNQEIKIQAQCYLEKFYQSFGFKTVTAPYPDWGIMHVDMVLPN
jgi:ElaA protein